MIDTLILFLVYDFANNKQQFEHILSLFTHEPILRINRITNEESYVGNIYNFNIRISHNSLTINGSICKFYHNSNQLTLSYDDFVHAIMELEILLNLNLDLAQVRRVDLAENLIVDQKPESYYPLFIKGGFLKRREDDNGLYYRNKNRTICLYDKIIEEKAHRNEIKPHLVNKNVLRVEKRTNRNREISKRLGVKNATLNDLIMKYNLLIELWRKSFDLIPKDIELNIPQDEAFITPTEFKNFLAIHGVKNLGGFGKVINMIHEAKARDVFSYPAQSCNLKTTLKKLVCKTNSSKAPAMLLELENKLDEARDKALVK